MSGNRLIFDSMSEKIVYTSVNGEISWFSVFSQLNNHVACDLYLETLFDWHTQTNCEIYFFHCPTNYDCVGLFIYLF